MAEAMEGSGERKGFCHKAEAMEAAITGELNGFVVPGLSVVSHVIM